ncbi:MAG: hypothetical protein WCK86_09410, partial [Planctomycetia bacterium]
MLGPHKRGMAFGVWCRLFVTAHVADGCVLRSEGDARRHVSFADPSCLQPRQGWFGCVGSSGGGPGLAIGYCLPALRAELPACQS